MGAHIYAGQIQMVTLNVFLLLQLRDENETLVETFLTPSNLMTGNITSTFHLNTFVDVECVHCYREHFFGQPIAEVTRLSQFCFMRASQPSLIQI